MKLAELCQELRVLWPNPMFFPRALEQQVHLAEWHVERHAPRVAPASRRALSHYS